VALPEFRNSVFRDHVRCAVVIKYCRVGGYEWALSGAVLFYVHQIQKYCVQYGRN
jgi:hypothetical protein